MREIIIHHEPSSGVPFAWVPYSEPEYTKWETVKGLTLGILGLLFWGSVLSALAALSVLCFAMSFDSLPVTP